MNYGNANFEDLKGKTILKIEDLKIGSDSVRFECSDGTKFQMWYDYDCCASCSVEDICGDIEDLIGSEILQAEESSSRDDLPGITKENDGSFTWTFYKIGTIKGTVTLRWYGQSNGYYSESVTFDKIEEKKK